MLNEKISKKLKLLKIVLFVYDFPHRKSLYGMQIIKNLNYSNVLVLSAPFRKLNIENSKLKISVFEKEFINPSDLTIAYNWKVLIDDHNSQNIQNNLLEYKPDLGIILGSRILSRNIIDKFKLGIVNFHPGVLPENRGLDNLKWAVYKSLPQGVTTHFIDKDIDVGKQIYLELVEVEKLDTLQDINSKLFYTQMKHLQTLLISDVERLKTITLNKNYSSHKPVPQKIDEKIPNLLNLYKKNYKDIIKNYIQNEKM